jgi:polyisoprenoid-binding protein YceI
MKTTFKVLFLSGIIATFAACTSGGSKTEATAAKSSEETSYNEVYAVNTDESQLEWQGWKPTGTHNGTVSITSGNLMAKDLQLVGGSFEIDMTSIIVLDIEDPEYNAKLRGHLTSADFFEVETFPIASFEITGIKAIDGIEIDETKEKGDIVPSHSITGNLTMKGISKSITFNAKVDISKSLVTAQTNQFYIDRSEWNVQYGSKKFFDDLKDKFINDEMGISIKLTATPAPKEMVAK